MATTSKGITLKVGTNILTNLQEIPELGGDTDSIEITTLADVAHVYTKGLDNYGENLAFKFLYENTQFLLLNGLGDEEQDIEVTLPDKSSCMFKGFCSAKLDGAGVGAALTYTLNIKPSTAFSWV